MDKALRNTLRNVVTQCRKLLEEAINEILQGQFGIHKNGEIEDASRMGHLWPSDQAYREQVLVHLQHIRAGGFKPADAVEQLIREVAFTHLNRLVAYKMLGQRKLIREAVSRGINSNGFKFYLADHPDDETLWSSGQQDVAYRHFLEWLGGTLSEEIGVLFSPHDPANRLFPRQQVLDQVLALINSEELKDIWTEDETIGWVYQYFTPKELREKARKESSAPRNSYELAFRNQFYTPRYVVQFLTDNTLGRIWYEMRKGETVLKEKCQYLVRRPNEVFLSEGEINARDAGDANDAKGEKSQEELLNEPVFIPHRPTKDPREIKILDPACGSGHFLIYCFDLLLAIYEEAWDQCPDLLSDLRASVVSKEEFMKQVPGLILRHNLHGIDIDLRATQIAALALWLRAQRAYQELGLKRDERPKITKSNIVCAEPMPGEEDLLEEFLKNLRGDRLETLIRRVLNVPEGTPVRTTRTMADSLCDLVREVWRKMRLAGEAGSLLKIEEELREAIQAGQQEWEEKQPLFRVVEFGLIEQAQESYLRLVPEAEMSFWERAESLVLAALQDYAAYAANGHQLHRQLFVDDAVRGFALVDICHKGFDVVLMNPPFGEASKPSKAYIERAYPWTKNDVYAAFVERWLGKLVPGGMLGAITSRTGFFLSSFQKWREEILLKEARPTVFADLGYGVLDTAMVETAAYCLVRSSA